MIQKGIAYLNFVGKQQAAENVARQLLFLLTNQGTLFALKHPNTLIG
jgi:hypothetical protein